VDEAFADEPTGSLPHAYGGPPLRGRLRQTPEDFVVEETLGYGPSGSGEHVWLKVRKRQHNTHDVARLLARHAGVAQVAVGYAGLKDRHAVTTQHFTVQLPGRDGPDWAELGIDGLELLEISRHERKIRRGGLRGNRFRLTVREVVGDRETADRRLERIAREGVPNYFGAQRFGRGGGNLRRVDALFAGSGRRPGREQRGLLLSAARAQLFNQVLAERVRTECWARTLSGDVLVLGGTQRQFRQDDGDTTLSERLATLDVHPTGPLCGRRSRSLEPGNGAADLESRVLADWAAWREGLERFGLDADRRALRLAVEELRWEWGDDSLRLSFQLAAGAYATTVLRELVAEPD
jgi:tRNA pseudouridine13 synthase